MMMSVMSSAPFPTVVAPDWAHTYFLGIFILFSRAFGGLTISLRHKVKELKYYIILLCHGDTQRELVNTPWTHHVLHLFLVEWGSLLMGDLVHFGTLWLY